MKIFSYLILGAIALIVPNEPSWADSKYCNTYLHDVHDQEADIKAIREEYNRINKLKLNAETFKYTTTDCVEGGEVTYYSFAGQVLKITEKGAMDDSVWRREYYYRDGKVIFCFESLDWGAAEGPVKTTEYRFYIKDGKSIREMSDKKIEDLTEKAAEAVSTAGKFLKVKTSKDFASVYCD